MKLEKNEMAKLTDKQIRIAISEVLGKFGVRATVTLEYGEYVIQLRNAIDNDDLVDALNEISWSNEGVEIMPCRSST
jgi:hypothetical protein